MAETPRQAKAFDIYYEMGVNGGHRSLRAVASEIGVSLTSVSKWAKDNKWKARIAERDAKNNASLFEATDKRVVDELVSYRKIISASIGDYIKNLKTGSVKINTPAEFIKLVELDMKLLQLQEQRDIDKDDTLELEISFVDDDDEEGD